MDNNYDKQISGVVSRHCQSEKIRSAIVRFVENLEEQFCSMKEVDAQPFKTKLYKDIVYPLVDRDFLTDASFLFLPPNVHRIGSFLLNCSIKNDSVFTVDIGLEMPPRCFQQKDHLNYVYHRKRALYLTYIASFLKREAKESISKIQFEYMNGDHLKPALLLTPSKALERYIRFRLLPFPAPEKGFQTHKLALDRCNIKHPFNGLEISSSPIYNSSILSDLCQPTVTMILREYFDIVGNLQSAMILVKLWLDARGLREQFSHILTLFTCHLIKTQKLNHYHSAAQIFRTIIESLSQSQWNTKAVIFNHDDRVIDEVSLSEEYLKHFDVVLIEATSGLNVCYNVTLDQYERLVFDAKITAKLLQKEEFSFSDICTTIDFSSYFDQYLLISNDYFKQMPTFVCQEANFIDSGMNTTQYVQTKIIDLLKFTVGERIELVQRKMDPKIHSKWNLNELPPKITSPSIYAYASRSNFLTIGIIINNDKIFEKLIKGPLADNAEESLKFRTIWGEKAEIRRFQNGEIREAVYWNADSVEEKRQLLNNIVKYILEKNLEIQPKLLTNHWTSSMDDMLKIKCLKFRSPSSLKSYGTGEELLSMAVENSSILKRHIHNLSDLSFTVIDVMPIDDSLCYSKVFPQLPLNSTDSSNSRCFSKLITTNVVNNKLTYIRSIRMIIKVDTNVKLHAKEDFLPNHKYLLHAELSKCLAKKHNIYSRSTPDSLLAFYRGYVYQLQIMITKEFNARRTLVNSAVGSAKNYLTKKLDVDEFDCFARAPIVNCLATLAKNNPAFSFTCRIFKRWLALLMIGHYFEDVTCDLIVAYAFMHYQPNYPEPRSSLNGFLRVVKLLSNIDFRVNALIINFNNLLSRERIAEIQSTFVSERQNLPALFIATPFDTQQLSSHTRQTPNALILNHLKRQANGIFSNLYKSSNKFQNFNCKELLKPSQSSYDIVIELKSDIISNKYESIDFPGSVIVQKTLFNDENADPNQIIPVTDYSPNVKYLNELKRHYSNLALFFYDHYGGRKIGVLLKPDVMELKPFKPSSLEASILTGTAYSQNVDYVTLNLNALMEDFAIQGEGIVENIKIESDRLFKQ